MKRNNFLIKMFCLAVTLSMRLYSQPLLTDSSATYEYKNETFPLGLYEGTNGIPAAHLAAGMEIAQQMRDMEKINIVPIGHSVPWTTFNGWDWGSAKTEFDLAPNTNFVNGSISAQMAWDWLNTVKNGGKLANLNNDDVHVLVVQLTWAPFFGPDDYEKNKPLSEKIDSMSHDLGRLAKNAKEKYPNLKMILMQADPWQNDHEPYHAYHEWFFARQVVLDQIYSESDYTGPDVDEVWLGMGGYWWKPNASGSYYTDCCHISGAGATYYRQAWVESLLETNPVVSQWLMKDPPTITPVKAENNAVPCSSVKKLSCSYGTNGIKVTFSLPGAAHIGLGLFSIDGRMVIPVSEKNCQAGLNSVTLNAGSLLSRGTYILRMNTRSNSPFMSMITVMK